MHLLRGEVSPKREEKLGTKSYLLDGRDLAWYTPVGNRKPVLAIHHGLVSHLMALVHPMHGHPSVASTLVLLRERSYWPTRTPDVQECVLSYGCRRRKCSTSQRTAMLPGLATQLWEVLEIDLTRVGVTSLAHNEYVLLAVEKVSKFRFEFPTAVEASRQNGSRATSVSLDIWGLEGHSMRRRKEIRRN